MKSLFNLNLYTILLFLLTSLSIIKCDRSVSFEEFLSTIDINRIDNLISQYEKDIQPKFDEITKIKNEEIKVSKYNIIFNLQYFFFNMRKSRADLAISALKLIKFNNRRTKSFEITIDQVESFIIDLNRRYVELLNTIKQSNIVFTEVLGLLKKVFYIIIIIIIALVLLFVLGVLIYYIKFKNYHQISYEDEKTSKSVKILSNDSNEKNKNKTEYIGVNDSKNNIKVE